MPAALLACTMNRRQFLGVSAAGLGAALFLSRKSAFAAPFGEIPSDARPKMLPPERRAKRVLEVFLYGGLSPWESLYFVEEYGRPNDPLRPYQQFYTFEPGSPSAAMTPREAMSRCGLPDQEPLGVSFAKDELGKDVKLGPFASVLRARTDVTERMRILVNQHNLEPHEAAIPLALTGKPVGSPTMAGLGTHIQRFFSDQNDAARKSPYSYVFSSGGLPGDNVQAAFATGMHPGRARPLRIKIDEAARLTHLLARPTLGAPESRAQHDELVAAYSEQYRQRLVYPGRSEAARSARLADLVQASGTVAHADAVAAVMEPRFFQRVESTVCDDRQVNIPLMSFKLAAHLLTHPSQPARYVCVVDTGLEEASGGGGYDTHSENSKVQARNLRNCLEQLTGIINKPGEHDPTKIDLDDTLVILNTEFGRTPTAQLDGDANDGRNHHPYGYATALIGGPVTGQQVVGAIGPDGVASSAVSPSEARIAALLALGIWPFSPEAFGVSDVKDASGEIQAVERVTQRVLGVTL
jgi:Protein of unknown function (DUF1501)